MKQTAVEWLFLMINNPNDNQSMALKCFEKAKTMEKEQIEEAYSDGVDDERYDRELRLGKYYQSVFKEDKQ